MPDVLTAILLLVVGAALGCAAGWAIAVARVRGRMGADAAVLKSNAESLQAQLGIRDQELAAARASVEAEKVGAAELRTRLESAREHFAEQRRQLEEMDKRFKDTFAALSADALKNSNEQFLNLADARLKPLREQLERYEKQIAALEKARAEAYGGLTRHLSSLAERSESLGREASQLAAALRQTGPKGKWGEVSLRRVIELSGLSEHCDFREQVSADGGRLSADVVISMPGGRTLVIDSKVNTGPYLDFLEAASDDDRRRHLDRYVSTVRQTARALGGKEYWRQFTPSPEFVVMFMPGEAFFAAAVGQDANLIGESTERGVIIASPTTLMALLLAVRHGWQQSQLAENAQRIAEAGRELYERLCVFVGHLGGVRTGIERAADAYNKAVGSWESRTLPAARRLWELGAGDRSRELPSLDQADSRMRSISSDDEAVDPTDPHP